MNEKSERKENENMEQPTAGFTTPPTETPVIENNSRNSLTDRLRKDSTGMGILIGIVVPAVTFGIIYGIVALILFLTNKPSTEIIHVDMIQKFILLSLIPSVFTLRHYLLKLKMDRTGRGILLVTFLIAILFAILEFGVK